MDEKTIETIEGSMDEAFQSYLDERAAEQDILLYCPTRRCFAHINGKPQHGTKCEMCNAKLLPGHIAFPPARETRHGRLKYGKAKKAPRS